MVALCILLCANTGYSSWQKINDLGTPIGCCFFFNDLVGLAGSGNTNNEVTLQIWHTTNGGVTWNSSSVPSGSGQVTQISIGSDGVGYASIYSTGNPFMNLWKTVDAGLTWTDVSNGNHLGSGVGYSKYVFATSQWNLPLAAGNNTNGVFLMDSNTFLITPGPNSKVNLAEAWGAFGDPSTRIWYAVTELSRTIFCSFDNGKNWRQRARINVSNGGYLTGDIIGYKDYLYVQGLNDGLYRGTVTDTAITWKLIGGPTNALDTRTIYAGGCRGEHIIAFDDQGGVYLSTDGGDGTLGAVNPIALSHPFFFQIPSCQTETKSFTVTDKHCYDLIIDSISMVTPTNAVFTLKGGPSLPDTLSSGAIDTFTLTFDPNKEPGAYHDSVHVHGHFVTNGGILSIDSIISIFTAATPEQPKISSTLSTLDFDTVSICGGSADSVFSFTNIGCDTLTITSGTGFSGGEITIDSVALPYVLPPDSVIVWHVHFRPKTQGAKQVTSSFSFTAQGLSGSQVIMLNGFGEDGKARLQSTPASIAFDTVSICGIGDSARIEFTNTGCVALIVDSLNYGGSSAFLLSSANTKRIVGPGDTEVLWVYFTPTSKGLHQGSVHIVTHSMSVDSTTMDETIIVDAVVTSGKQHLTQSVGAIDLGTFSECSSRDTSITITNTGCDTVIVYSATLTGAGFSIGGTFPDTLSPNASQTISVHAEPIAGTLNYNGTVLISSSSDSSLKPITLTFTVSQTAPNLTFYLTIDVPQADAGGVTTVHIKADPTAVSLHSSAELALTYNTDLLVVSALGGSNVITTVSSPSNTSPGVYRITGNPNIVAASDSTIATITYNVFLTKDTNTSIDLAVKTVDDSVPGSGPCTPTVSSSGTSFTYISACADGSMRNAMSGLPILQDISIEPNPSNADVDLHFQSSTETEASVSLTSMSGITVLNTSVKVTAGQNMVHLQTASLPSGNYVVELAAVGQIPVRSRLVIAK